jgi:diguanylate cyclase (GGDEF)-like protein
VLAVDLLAIGAVAYGLLAPGPVAGLDWIRFGMLLAGASLHVLVTQRQEEARRSRTRSLHVELTSIWTFPAVLLLPFPLAVLLIFTVRTVRYFVARRPVHRFVLSSATVVLAGFAVHQVLSAFGPIDWTARGWPASATLFGLMLLAGAVYPLAEILLVGGAIAFNKGKLNLAVLGTRYDNSLEAMTVALGMISAVLLVDMPALLVIMVVLAVLGNRFAEIRQLQVDVRTDPKTGLLNMRGWRQSAEREMARAERSGAPLGLLMVDLDHFKTINDTWGHPAGDDVLTAVAEVLRTETRPSDVPGRFGGEEFVVLLPESDGGDSVAVAERIRIRIAALSVATTDKRGAPTVISGRTTSIGVASRDAGGGTLEDLLHGADAAVYDAKEGGRDQVRLARPVLRAVPQQRIAS